MRTIYFVLEHPFAVVGLLIAVLYGWSTFGKRQENLHGCDAKQVIRTFSPSAVVIILVLAASAGLKLNLPRVDFGMFYSSALLLRQDPGHLYDPQKQTEFLHAVTGLKGEPHYLPFAYPPFVAFIFAPMTVLSFRTAYYVMLAVNFVVLAFTFWWLSTRLKFRQDQLTAFLVSASGALPMYAVLVLGHLTFVGMLLLSLFATDLIGNRKTRAGLWAGLLLYKPTLFPIPLLLLLWKRQWRAVGLCAVVNAALLFLSIALVGWSGLQANIAMMRVMTSDYLLPKTQSLRGLVFAAGLGIESWVVLAVAAVALLWIAFARAQDQRWVMAAAIVAVLLVPPYLQFHDLALGLIGIAFALAGMDMVADRTRNYLFFIALIPAGLVLATRDRQVIPIMPLVLVLLFAYCLWKSFGERLKTKNATHSTDFTD